MKSALLCTVSFRLAESLNATLTFAGYDVEVVATAQDAIGLLKEGPRDALICESRRDAFAFLMRAAFRLHPQMPVHFIDAGSVFCLYPFARQPPDLIDAITAADIRIPAAMLRPLHVAAAVTSPPPFLV